MKKTLRAVLAAGVGIAASALYISLQTQPAEAVITGSAHDFSGQAWNAGGEICQPCHTPHNAPEAASGPLWNHDITASTFTLYTSPTGTLDATLGQPAGASALCLSCHDGSVALDSFGGNTGTNFITGSALLGIDLSDDHPVSFTYDAALAGTDGQLVNPAADGDTDADTVGAAVPYLPLFAGSLECASCHDVHNNGGGTTFLLRMDNTTSALCLKCHVK